MSGNDFPGIGFTVKVPTYKYLPTYVQLDHFQVWSSVSNTRYA